MVKGYQKAIRAKLLHVVDEDFCPIPTNGANCQFLVRLSSEASAARYKPTKEWGSGAMC